MKYLIIISALFCSLQNILAQDSLLFQKYEFDKSYKIIGLCYSNDMKVDLKDLSFYISDLTQLNKLKTLIKYGKPARMAVEEDKVLYINIVKGKEIQKDEIYINPTYSTISIEDKYYEFDMSQLRSLNKQFPVSYTYNDTTFKSEDEFKKYILIISANKNLLCYQDITREFGGICNVYINRSVKCKTGEQAIAILKRKLVHLGFNDKDFLIEEVFLRKESDKFMLALRATKDKYDKLTGDGIKKTEWKAYDFEIISYWKK